MIEVKNLEKSFGKNHVLRGINETINEGEVVCIIGPSGSGKSTFLRCLNLLEQPTSGEVILDGEKINAPDRDIDKIREKLGMVFQNFNLFPHMSVLDNITMAPIKVKGQARGEAEAEARRLLDVVGLLDKAEAIRLPFPGVRSSVWPLPGRWRWNRKSCCSMNRLLHWTRKWWAKFWPL